MREGQREAGAKALSKSGAGEMRCFPCNKVGSCEDVAACEELL